MPTGMSLRFFGAATCRGFRGVSLANYGLKLPSRLAAPALAYYVLQSAVKRRGQDAGSQLNLFVRRHTIQ
jgi:hypothetical protein